MYSIAKLNDYLYLDNLAFLIQISTFFSKTLGTQYQMSLSLQNRFVGSDMCLSKLHLQTFKFFEALLSLVFCNILHGLILLQLPYLCGMNH